jgi:integrase/recombinase XerC
LFHRHVAVDGLAGAMLLLGHMNNIRYAEHQASPQSLIPRGQAAALEMSVEAFLRALVGKNRSAGTLRAYGADLHQFVAWLRENDGVLDHPGQVTRADIEAYLAELGAARIAGVTRARKLAAIREYFRFLEDHGAIPRSPATGVETPKRERHGRTWLRPDEYSRMLLQASGHIRDYAILQVFLQTGVRVSELAGLAVADIDLAAQTLTVRAGKGLADRSIELERKANAALKNWLAVRPLTFTDVLFVNRFGAPLSERGVRRIVEKYRTAAALTKKASPHSLRHTFASYKATKGVPLRQVQEWLGHKSLATTQIYLHLDRRDAKKAMEATSL